MQWVGNVTRTVKKSNAKEIMVMKLDRKTLLCRPTCRRKNNILSVLRDIRWKGMGYIQPDLDGDQR